MIRTSHPRKHSLKIRNNRGITMSQNKQAKNSKTISYAESIRKLKETWDNEPVTFTGGIRLNYNVCYND